ncbi:cyclopropane-fatty-acyl-phospholipid synthase family protein [Nibrella viscosa]|uniref:Cyclopropane-fatty-acyl-phospholipid synthase family protein n=1 Tax=Nibrella viscosa TaxID=1084524 RepID=A0ABP8JQW4_9BACT
MDNQFMVSQFPRSSAYHPEWITAGVSGGANPLWMTEWLTQAMDLRPGMRVLDLGCGRAVSSVFLHREFGVQVWACDLWFSVTENFQRIRDAGCEQYVFPLHAEAHSLPFAAGYFDAIVSIDSFPYYGTDDLYLNYLARLLKPGGQIGIAGAGLMQEFNGVVPEHLRHWWTPDLWGLHAADWWRQHWSRTGIVAVDLADSMPEGYQLWLAWHRAIAPDNHVEIEALENDRGRYLGYVRVVGHRTELELEEPLVSLPAQYSPKALLRDGG